MATDDERREVARRLRKARVERYNSILNGIHLGHIVGVCAQIVSPHEDQVRAAADRLADLIEPSCDAAATNTDATATRDVSQCRRSDVDRDALLALADELQFEQEFGNTDYESVSKLCDQMDDCARRIRDALGVSE